MSMDLSGAGGHFRFNNWGWESVLELATMYGWEPAGTELEGYRVLPAELSERWHQWARDNAARAEQGMEPIPDPIPADAWVFEPRDPPWKGIYDSNDGQWVTDEDAARLADALERALPDISDFGKEEGSLPPIASLENQLSPEDGYSGSDDDLLERFAGKEWKEYLGEFITFCRAGGFTIIEVGHHRGGGCARPIRYEEDVWKLSLRRPGITHYVGFAGRAARASSWTR